MIVSLWASAVLAALQPAPSVEALEWLEGHWRAEDRRIHNSVRFTEEIWVEGMAGAMFGINRTVRDGGTASFEYMRIVEEEGEEGSRLVFIAQPNGASPSRFPMVSHRPYEIVFANPAHDHPQRIVYRRAGDLLTGTISLEDGSRPMQWSFRLQRAR